MKNRFFSILPACTIMLFLSCQRDDICPEGTETTPRLQIEFFDAESPETLKVVENLLLVVVGENDTLLGPTTTNNISIPLRTSQSFTEFKFISNSGTASENEDIVRFDYLPTPDYVNRACGFKINFLDLTLVRNSNGDNWIVTETVNIEDIENETATHISFTH